MTSRRRRDHGTWRSDAGLLAGVAVVLRIPALLASAHLTFDDGVYGASVLALRDGGRPYLDVFSSQGPLHLPLLYAFDLLGFRTLDAPRLASVAAGAIATVAAYAIARRFTTRVGAVVAAILVASSGSMLYVTGPISGDGPALALATLAVLCALRYREQPGAARAALTGVVMGAALCVKLLVLPAVLPVGLVLLGGRRRPHFVAAVSAAIAVFLASALPWGLDTVWEQSVAYHQGAERTRSYGGNVVQLLETLVQRDPWVVAALVLSLVGLIWTRRHRTPVAIAAGEGQVPVRLALGLLGAWAGAQALLLVVEPAMWRPHVSQLIVPLALLAVIRPAPWPALAAAAVLLTPWALADAHTMVVPDGYDRVEARVVERLRELPTGAQVVTDEPGFAWRAERRPPDDLVDASIKRIQKGDLTGASVARAARRTHVCAVLVWSERRFGSFRDLPRRLDAVGYHVAARYGHGRVLYARGRCAP